GSVRADRELVQGFEQAGQLRAPADRQDLSRVACGSEPYSAATRQRVRDEVRPGDQVEVWLDSRGRVVTAPVTDADVWQHALSVGGYAAGGAVVVLLLGRAGVRRVAWRHRMDEWERAWARTGPQWSKRRA
ncbi:hypothetical protein, partial [Streptomyces sp. NPDC007070]|uniref:hypothetical protein n=1 Tax=Streptomyces sp. NPDC007070 TaxID=3154312 RepID=UPI0033E8BFE9